MKKSINQIITVIALAIFMLGGFRVEAQSKCNFESKSNLNYLTEESVVKVTDLNISFWGGLLADAAGALGGGAAAAEIGGFVGVVTGGVGAGIVVGAGALIGGAAASYAYANKSNTSLVKDKEYFTKIKLAKNQNNKWDYIGLKHNNLLINYKGPKNLQNFYNYIIKENNFDSKVLPYKNVRELSNKINNFNTRGEYVNYILSLLPKSVNKDNFKKGFNNLLDRLSLSNIKSFENSIKKSNRKILPVDEVKIDCFFSVFRYSYVLWSN